MGGTTVLDASGDKSAKKRSKKRGNPEANATVPENITNDKEVVHGVELDVNEPTMAEKLSSFGFTNNEITEVEQKKESLPLHPPSADSVHVLLKQAIHADDRTLLLDCLYNQDQKVVSNSISLLSSSDIFKLMKSLLSIVQSRGAVLACALPWLRSLLLQHASKIMSQESSLVALNSLYQLIESRVSTFHPTVKLASCLDTLYSGMSGDLTDEDEGAAPVIYDDDSEDDNESKDAMDTDEEDTEEVEGSSNVSDAEECVENERLTRLGG